MVSTNTTSLDDRYGRTPGRARRDRALLWTGGAIFVAILAGWVVWAGLDFGSSTLSARDIGHRIVSDSSVAVTYEVSVTEGTEVSCALQAQNEAHAIVGWRIVDLPASDRFTRQFTDELRTTEPAVTGLIYRCWLT